MTIYWSLSQSSIQSTRLFESCLLTLRTQAYFPKKNTSTMGHMSSNSFNICPQSYDWLWVSGDCQFTSAPKWRYIHYHQHIHSSKCFVNATKVLTFFVGFSLHKVHKYKKWHQKSSETITSIRWGSKVSGPYRCW